MLIFSKKHANCRTYRAPVAGLPRGTGPGVAGLRDAGRQALADARMHDPVVDAAPVGPLPLARAATRRALRDGRFLLAGNLVTLVLA